MRVKVKGFKMFRGFLEQEEHEIKSVYIKDWFLVPKEEEEDFCKIDKVYIPPGEVPSKMNVPPYMQRIVLDRIEVFHRVGMHVDATTCPLLTSNIDRASRRKYNITSEYLERIQRTGIDMIKKGQVAE